MSDYEKSEKKEPKAPKVWEDDSLDEAEVEPKAEVTAKPSPGVVYKRLSNGQLVPE